ncbi:vanadium-dependent haloperoxidase [Rhizobium ruizarguesonis]
MLNRHLMPAIIVLGTMLAASSSFGQSSNLQPETRQEFRRTYGSDGNLGNPSAPSASVFVSQSLQPETVEEFKRVFGSNVLSGAAELQDMSTPSTINSTVLNSLLDSSDPRRYVILWHLIAVDLTAIDHRATLSASPATYHEQFGPARAARALALIHQAIFEAANKFDQRYASSLSDPVDIPTSGASQDAAVVEAAYQVIAWLYPGLHEVSVEVADPNQTCSIATFNVASYYSCSLASITDTAQRNAGMNIGRAIAGQIITSRSHDGSERVEPVWGKDFIPRQAPGKEDYAYTQWQPDPVSQLMTALGGYWGTVRPFAMTSGFQFRPYDDHSPIKMVRDLAMGGGGGDAYKALPSYNAVHQWGRETRLDRSGRMLSPAPSKDGWLIAQFWAYDATANLCAPARLYNQIAAAVLNYIDEHPGDSYAIDTKSITDVARFYAMVNMAMADAAVGAWDAKFYFQFPRPVSYIRALEEKTSTVSPSPKWFPVGAQVTNSDQTFNITPPFPSYPSGHAVFGGALTGILRQYMKPTAQFTFMSDEFNGKNKDVFNYVRCSDQDAITPKSSKFCSARTFTLDCAERENADSRLFMGVHWVFDADDGITMGNKVAKQAYATLMNPIQNGQPVTPISHTFSVDHQGEKPRTELICPDVVLPAGWDDVDGSVGFGRLAIERVDAL